MFKKISLNGVDVLKRKSQKICERKILGIPWQGTNLQHSTVKLRASLSCFFLSFWLQNCGQI